MPACGTADLCLNVRWGEPSGSSLGTPIFDSGGTWRLYRDGPLEVFRFWAGPRFPNPFLECRLALGRRTGEVIVSREYFGPDEPVAAFQYPLDEVLMVHLLGRGKGVELHACGVVTPEGRGYLFAGQSGDGKTTTARLWEGLPGTRILSDDRIVIREEAGRFIMYGTPWHGEAELAIDGRAPVEEVFVLEHGRANELRTLTAAQATALLGARSFIPFHDVEAMQWSLGFLDRFVRTVPCMRLAFVPNESVRSFVDGRARIRSEGAPAGQTEGGGATQDGDEPGELAHTAKKLPTSETGSTTLP